MNVHAGHDAERTLFRCAIMVHGEYPGNFVETLLFYCLAIGLEDALALGTTADCNEPRSFALLSCITQDLECEIAFMKVAQAGSVKCWEL